MLPYISSKLSYSSLHHFDIRTIILLYSPSTAPTKSSILPRLFLIANSHWSFNRYFISNTLNFNCQWLLTNKLPALSRSEWYKDPKFIKIDVTLGSLQGCRQLIIHIIIFFYPVWYVCTIILLNLNLSRMGEGQSQARATAPPNGLASLNFT